VSTIYISDYGDDENDGRSKKTAVYSWGRVVNLCDGRTETNLMQGGTTLKRLHEEMKRRKKTLGKPAEVLALGTPDPTAG
jgi:hypothetical protein